MDNSMIFVVILTVVVFGVIGLMELHSRRQARRPPTESVDNTKEEQKGKE